MIEQFTEKDFDRFWSKVKIPANIITDCWEWTASRHHFGHGKFGHWKHI